MAFLRFRPSFLKIQKIEVRGPKTRVKKMSFFVQKKWRFQFSSINDFFFDKFFSKKVSKNTKKNVAFFEKNWKKIKPFFAISSRTHARKKNTKKRVFKNVLEFWRNFGSKGSKNDKKNEKCVSSTALLKFFTFFEKNDFFLFHFCQNVSFLVVF